MRTFRKTHRRARLIVDLDCNADFTFYTELKLSSSSSLNDDMSALNSPE